jgi:hypothetical protein
MSAVGRAGALGLIVVLLIVGVGAGVSREAGGAASGAPVVAASSPTLSVYQHGEQSCDYVTTCSLTGVADLNGSMMIVDFSGSSTIAISVHGYGSHGPIDFSLAISNNEPGVGQSGGAIFVSNVSTATAYHPTIWVNSTSSHDRPYQSWYLFAVADVVSTSGTPAVAGNADLSGPQYGYPARCYFSAPDAGELFFGVLALGWPTNLTSSNATGRILASEGLYTGPEGGTFYLVADDKEKAVAGIHMLYFTWSGGNARDQWYSDCLGITS